MELNTLGCQRTVEEWQHIWEVWRVKVKTKARKVRDHINRTGGGPAGPSLTELDEKILDIIGRASVYGFADEEFGLQEPPRPNERQEDPPAAPPQNDPELSPQRVLPSVNADPAPRNSSQQRGRRRRRRVVRVPRPPIRDSVVNALNENNRLMRQVIEDASARIALAIRESASSTVRVAEILAAALRGDILEEIHVEKQ